jgi:bifunctional non-homologous end joining protein LigD
MKAKKPPAEKEKNEVGTAAPFPADIQPMLATLVDKPIDEPGWMYEVKWDGYRAIAYMNEGKVEIRSRNNKSFEEKYYPIVNALKKWGVNAVVDGEIVVVNEKGVPDFGDLQNWRSEADGNLAYYVFDILYFEGKDLMNLNLTDRRAILQSPEVKNG